MNYCSEESKSWKEEETLDGHSDWVRDVAWAPNVGLPKSYLASCSQVRKLFKIPTHFFFFFSYFLFRLKQAKGLKIQSTLNLYI